MGRPLKGFIRFRGTYWEGSVPDDRNASGRMTSSFSNEADCQRWVDEQVARIKAGKLPELPQRRETVTALARGRQRNPSTPAISGLSFEQVARAWHHEKYVALRGADAERRTDVMRTIERHLIPAFATLFALNFAAGRMLVVDWVRAMSGREPLDAGSPCKPGTPYARRTVGGYLATLNEVIGYARRLEPSVPDYADGIGAMDPIGAKPKVARLVSLLDAVRICSKLHVIHQIALWLMRAAGLRISEAYGLAVGDLYIDEDHFGVLTVHHQGGRGFVHDDRNDTTVKGNKKRSVKTEAGYRVVPLPKLLTVMLVGVVRVFHTHNGVVDMSARLIPAIRSDDGGQAGFRTALAQACFELDMIGSEDDVEEVLTAHVMRKSFGTDAAWAPELSEMQKRRVMGHRAGSDVFALTYSLDKRLRETLRPVAEMMDAEFENDDVDTLITPVVKRPLYGKARDQERLDRIDSELNALGWQIDPMPGYITADDAAELLGMVVTATRRLFPDVIPAKKVGKVWYTRTEDVVAWRDRNEGRVKIDQLATEIERSYHQTYQLLRQLGLTVAKDDYDGSLLLTTEQADAARAEVARVSALHSRSVKVSDAAGRLGITVRAVHLKLREGKLSLDPETDSSRAKYVTKESIERCRRPGRNRDADSTTIDDFRRLSRLTIAQVEQLVRLEVLVRTGRGRLTNGSIQRWVVGYRPDLAGSMLNVS